VFVELGKIVGVWGVKGWIKLHSYTRNRADIATYPNWYLQSNNRSSVGAKFNSPTLVEIVNCREQGQGIVAQFVGFNDRDAAEKLIGLQILVKKTDLPKLPADEYYWQELIGLDVSTVDAIELGEIKSILETGANDVLVVHNKEPGGEDILIPKTSQVVKEVNIKQGTMIVDWDPSFLLD
jgi:16S rRNA processing protein RimM